MSEASSLYTLVVIMSLMELNHLIILPILAVLSTKYTFYPYYNQYGESKWEAEKVVSSHCKNSLIIRIPVLYGPGDFSESSILSLYNQLIQKKECYIDHIAKRVPTLTTDIAITIHAFIYSRSTIRGIVHISSNV